MQAPDFFRNDGHTGLQALNYNPAILIGGVLAVVGPQHLAIGLSDQERHAFQRSGGSGDVLLNH